MSAGIYKIQNKINGKIYIGSSIDMHTRWICHKSELRLNKKQNNHLQNAWNKYGEDAFEFIALQETNVPQSFLRLLENLYIQRLRPEYNIALYATENAMYGRKRKCSEETKRKISKAMTGKNNPNYGRVWGKEYREKMSRALKGRKFSKETRKKMSEALKGRKFSEEHKRKLSESRKGISVTGETKKKISKSLKGRYLGENGKNAILTRKQVMKIRLLRDTEGLTYEVLGSMFGVAEATIGRIVRGETWRHV